MIKQESELTENQINEKRAKLIYEKNQKKILLKKYLKNMNSETRFKFWIKTLLASINTFPQIINTLDRIIEVQASTVSFTSDVFNGKNSLESQVNEVIDLSQRKCYLLNIYIMTKELIKYLTEEELEFIEKRYVFKFSVEYLAKEYNISLRTAYRRIDKIIDKIYKNAIEHHWTLRFIESQTSKELWLKERYFKAVNDYFKNSNYQVVERELFNNENELAQSVS